VNETPEPDLRELFDDQIVSQIQQLQRAAYRGLSKTHREALADLQAEARRRKLNTTETNED